jgi:uncharacterized C2H2 Zn-finger protein
MKCPNCKYEYRTYTDYGERLDSRGDFFKFPIQMERYNVEYVHHKERIDLYGCPECELTFIGRDYE